MKLWTVKLTTTDFDGWGRGDPVVLFVTDNEALVEKIRKTPRQQQGSVYHGIEARPVEFNEVSHGWKDRMLERFPEIGELLREPIPSRVDKALEIAPDGAYDGDHHKMWAIDQMVRALTGCPMETVTAKDYKGVEYTYEAQGESDEYLAWVREYQDGVDGPDTYEWDEGIAP